MTGTGFLSPSDRQSPDVEASFWIGVQIEQRASIRRPVSRRLVARRDKQRLIPIAVDRALVDIEVAVPGRPERHTPAIPRPHAEHVVRGEGESAHGPGPLEIDKPDVRVPFFAARQRDAAAIWRQRHRRLGPGCSAVGIADLRDRPA